MDDLKRDPERIWQRVREGLVTAVVGRLPDPPAAFNLLRVSCEVAPAALRPLLEARRLTEAVLGDARPRPPERARPSRRRTLFGETPERATEAVVVELWNHLARQTGARWVVVFDAVEQADEATLAALTQVVRRPGWMQLPLLLVFHGPPTGAAEELLAAVRGRGGDALLAGEAPQPAAAAAPEVDWRGLPPEVLRVLRAGALIGPGFETRIVADLLELEPLAVLERLQQATDLGVPVEDRGEGRFSLPTSALTALAASLLPSLAQAWHRRLGRLLGARAGEEAASRPAKPPLPRPRRTRIPTPGDALAAEIIDLSAEAVDVTEETSLPSSRAVHGEISDGELSAGAAGADGRLSERSGAASVVGAGSAAERELSAGTGAADGAGGASVVGAGSAAEMELSAGTGAAVGAGEASVVGAGSAAERGLSAGTGAADGAGEARSAGTGAEGTGAPELSAGTGAAEASERGRGGGAALSMRTGAEGAGAGSEPSGWTRAEAAGGELSAGTGAEGMDGGVRELSAGTGAEGGVAEGLDGGVRELSARTGAEGRGRPAAAANDLVEGAGPADASAGAGPERGGSAAGRPSPAHAVLWSPTRRRTILAAASEEAEVEADAAGWGEPSRAEPSRPQDPLVDEARAAEHLRLAGEYDAAAQHLAEAARTAADMGAPQAAAQHAGSALALLATLPPSPTRRHLKVQVLLELGRVQWQSAGYDLGFTLAQALATLESARAELDAGAPAELAAELAQALAGVCFDLGDPASLERALAELARARHLLDSAGDPTGAACLLNDQAAVLVRMGEPVRALQLLRESRRRFAARVGEDPVALRELAETEHLFAQLPLHAQMRPGREDEGYAMGIDHALAAERAYHELGEARELARVWETMGRLELARGRPEPSRRRLEAAAEVQTQLGDLTGLAQTTEALSGVLARLGRDAEAVTLLRDSVVFNRDKGSPLGLTVDRRAFTALAARLAGEPQHAAGLQEVEILLTAGERELGIPRDGGG
jgi:tetratricopeptide (TPR) repeat protein